MDLINENLNFKTVVGTTIFMLLIIKPLWGHWLLFYIMNLIFTVFFKIKPLWGQLLI